MMTASAASAGCLVSAKAKCSAAINAEGLVGRTSYTAIPFVNSVYQISWGSSPGLAPTNLFWQSGSNFTSLTTMSNARIAASALTTQGVVAASGAQRWEDTYEASRPASEFPGEPSWINDDRQQIISQPEFKAWAAWEKAHENLFMVGSDGGQMAQEFRAWKGSWGHISPLMPLAKADWPAGMTNATYGDWFAYRWGQTAAKSGAYAIQLSDFSDSQPAQPSWTEGFNPEITAAFGKSIGKAVPGATIAAKAAYINAHYTVQWNDFLAKGYAGFYKSLATQLGGATGEAGLVIDQCGMWPSARRFYGIDETTIASVVGTEHYICIWDDQTMQVGRSGESMIWGIGGMVLAAAREPDIRNGANLSADDDQFWQATANFWPNLGAAAQHERGLKELKRAWLETAWSQIATRQGDSRRAMAFLSRDYWDGGKLDAKVTGLIRTVVPTKPFGFALYYSNAAERAKEAKVPVSGDLNASYMNPDILMHFKNGGGAVNYYVATAGLAKLKPASKPAAWLVLDAGVPAAELNKLKAIAPVLTSLGAAKSFAKAPLAYSDGLAGIGFYDQHNRLIVTATNQGSGTVNGKITLKTLPAGAYTATDLIAGGAIKFTVGANGGALPLSVTRWDTRAFAIVKN
ncbi:MAG TPA: hypothetical protein VH722_00595 [Alphaproteobacteria bacterium]|jgi:hypothetical protein|nr:hypothetical protein [Alphaproteobacteria bacterium]